MQKAEDKIISYESFRKRNFMYFQYWSNEINDYKGRNNIHYNLY